MPVLQCILKDMKQHLTCLLAVEETVNMDLDEKLREMIRKSCRLQIMMFSSRAIWKIGSLEPFQEALTSSHGTDTTDPVCRVVTTPSLRKFGNADGEDLEMELVVCKRRAFAIYPTD